MKTITLHPDSPYTVDAIATGRVPMETIQALLEEDTEPYALWWDTLGLDPAARPQRVASMLAMVEGIQTLGYDAWAAKSTLPDAPIGVSINQRGRVSIYDGTHRACVLYALGRPIPATVYRRAPSWAAVIDSLSSHGLYQSHPHPDLAGRRAYRVNVERYEVIGNALVDLGCRKVVELGSNYGVGCVSMAQQGLDVIGLEHTPSFEALQRSLFAVHPGLALRSVRGGRDKCRSKGVDAFVGLSVWHHLARDTETLDAWIEHTKGAAFQVIELPEPGSTTWTSAFADEAGGLAMCRDYLLTRLLERGGYKVQRTLYVDSRYVGRETLLLVKS